VASRIEEHPTSNIQHPTPNLFAAARSERELPSPVAELLRPSDARPIPADPGAAAALRGSILFAGLSQAPKRTPKAPAVSREPVANIPAEEFFTDGLTPFVLSATPPSADEFSLPGTLKFSDIRLVDLRRLAVAPESSSASVLEVSATFGRLAWLSPDAEARSISPLRGSPKTGGTRF